MENQIDKLREIKQKALLGGGKDKIEKQHQKGKMTAREKIERLIDPGSFLEWNMLLGHVKGIPTEGIIAGNGKIDGRSVCVYAQDSTILGGSIGDLHGYKMYHTIERALDMRVPLIGLHDSPGARVVKPEEAGAGLGNSEKWGGSVFFPNTMASGVVPQISAIMGSCAGISVYSPALNDFIYMVDGLSHMFITGPRIVKSVMGEDISMEDLGGAKIHAKISGVADFRVKTEEECLSGIRRLLSYLPSNNTDPVPVVVTDDSPDRMDNDLGNIVPQASNKGYDMRKIIMRLSDNGDFYEVKAEFAPEIVVGFARLGGMSVGFVANQPMSRAGSLTMDSSDKQARFIRFCDAFNIPIILLVDTPAYMPGSYQEHRGIIRHGAKVLFALCEATVPRLAVVIRKSYGGGSLGMGITPGFQTDAVYYWPSAESGVLGAEQSIELFYKDEIAKSTDPEKFKQVKLKEYREKYANPLYQITDNPFIVDIIEPAETRKILIKNLQFLRTKKISRPWKKHGNIPL
ncbi:MAG: acyl-CoA carboxylase subunit beta [Dehalococcoidales bacterium]|nr:acyl-CoA carboxylase subunit beta [Dehalococcoidales bacterium]